MSLVCRWICVLLLSTIVLESQAQSESEPNGTAVESSVLTIANATSITGDVCIGASCPAVDPIDYWHIKDGNSGTFVATWSDNITMSLLEYNNAGRTGPPVSSTVLTSGVAQTLSSSSFYTFFVQFVTVNSFTAYAISLSGTALPSSAPISATMAVTVFLEGAYNGTNLNTSLNSNIPTTQPYSINGHAGGETAGSIPVGAVDWVLVELREAGSATAALSSTRVGSAAGFLMNDGSIKATDGTSDLSIALSGNTGSDFFVVIYHRNHLPIMSATAQSATSTISVDFTGASATAFNGTTGLATLSGGKFGMLAGDADGDGDIDATDLATWKTQNGGVFGYNTTNGDFNLDGVINAVDRNDFQRNNDSKTSQVPTT